MSRCQNETKRNWLKLPIWQRSWRNRSIVRAGVWIVFLPVLVRVPHIWTAVQMLMAMVNLMGMVWRMLRHCWTDCRPHLLTDVENVVGNCAINVLHNCQPVTNDANPLRLESENMKTQENIEKWNFHRLIQFGSGCQMLIGYEVCVCVWAAWNFSICVYLWSTDGSMNHGAKTTDTMHENTLVISWRFISRWVNLLADGIVRLGNDMRAKAMAECIRTIEWTGMWFHSLDTVLALHCFRVTSVAKVKWDASTFTHTQEQGRWLSAADRNLNFRFS